MIFSITLRRVCKTKTILYCSLILYIIHYFGILTHIFERDFYKDFDYPLEGDILTYVRQIRNGETPSILPINIYNYSFIHQVSQKCNTGDRMLRPRLVIIIKSALGHFENRRVIRQTWGYEKRFSDVNIKTVFILGISKDPDPELDKQILSESTKYGDIVQSSFFDTYFNNTIKTMMGMNWVVKNCPSAKFYLFVDDDYYVSIKNILMFIRNPTNYPEYLEEADEVRRKAARGLASSEKNKSYDQLNYGNVRRKRHILDYELKDDVRLFSGYVFISSPHRHMSSKWYIPLSEYPWHMWPAYVTSGAYILSREALHDMYYSSLYTKHFRFDDIFLGLVAMKAHIEPLHSDQFYFHRAEYSEPPSYKYLLASHGFSNAKELFSIWNQVRSAGYA